MRIRMKINVAGTFHNNPEGVRVGDVVDYVDDENAQRYIDHDYAEEVEEDRKPRVEEQAVKPVTEERAVVEPDLFKPVKRSPGRPRKTT